jgi:hypothetical protein
VVVFLRFKVGLGLENALCGFLVRVRVKVSVGLDLEFSIQV